MEKKLIKCSQSAFFAASFPSIREAVNVHNTGSVV